MSKRKLLFITLVLLFCSSVQSFSYNKNVIVQLFNWKFNDITEAIPELSEIGYSHIHVSPPTKSIDTDVWWGRYQPTSYLKIEGPLGSEADFIKMNKVANEYNVEIIVDMVINHMAGGDYVDINNDTLQEVYLDGMTTDDFNPYWKLEDWGNPVNVQLGWLYEGALPDLKTSSQATQKKLQNYIQNLLSMGVDGFRIDAAIHIPAEDLNKIFEVLPKEKLYFSEIVNSDVGKIEPYLSKNPNMDFYDFPLLYTMVKSFKIGGDLRELKQPEKSRKALYGTHAITLVRNHDIDRGQAEGDSGLRDGGLALFDKDIELAYAFIFAREDGIPYVFVDMINPAPEVDVVKNETYDRDFIKKGIKFHNMCVQGNGEERREEIWRIQDENIIAFQRGEDRFAVINKAAERREISNFITSLEPGKYSDLLHGDTLEVNESGVIENWIFNGREAYLFVKNN